MARYEYANDQAAEVDIVEIRPNDSHALRKKAEDNFGDVPMDAAWSRSWIVSYGYHEGYIHRWVRDGEVIFTIREVK